MIKYFGSKERVFRLWEKSIWDPDQNNSELWEKIFWIMRKGYFGLWENAFWIVQTSILDCAKTYFRSCKKYFDHEKKYFGSWEKVFGLCKKVFWVVRKGICKKVFEIMRKGILCGGPILTLLTDHLSALGASWHLPPSCNPSSFVFFNTLQCPAIPCNALQCPAIPSNTPAAPIPPKNDISDGCSTAVGWDGWIGMDWTSPRLGWGIEHLMVLIKNC